MKTRILLLTLIVILLAGSLAFAEDGKLYRRNISKTPEAETEKAAIYMMDFYVPAQDSTGLVAPVDDYYLDDGDDGTCDAQTGEGCTAAYEPRDYAKPLISVYIDDTGGETDISEAIRGGMSFGHFDAYVAYSLDDGDSWRTENMSRSADLSSFNLANGYAYPGDVHNVVHQVAEDKILLVWASKYCQSGFPLYSLDPDDTEDAEYLADLEDNWGKNALFLYDFFGVAGPQGSVNYTEQGFPEVGEIPYSCIWTARGKLLPGDDPMTADAAEASHIVWTAPERLTSGVRDANLPAVDCAKGAGCALTWQEDPEGLRPGKGLGPGEGWSGAIANAKTDIWYSYITYADFDYVVDEDTGEVMLIEEYEALKTTDMDRPKPYVPMAMPVRLTDNDMCRATAGTNSNPEDPFCWIDFDSIDDIDHTNVKDFVENLSGPEEGADFCATSEPWTNPGGTTLEICVTEDGRWMIGRVASTRVRMVIKPYTSLEAVDMDGDGLVENSAWLSLAAEETKALGITVEEGETFDPIDIGKDMFYYSFDFAKPYNLHVNTALDTVDTSPYLVQQGGMLNAPAKCSPYFITTDQTHPDIVCVPYEFFAPQIDPITGYEYYLTEISRRFALTLNNIPAITDPGAGGSGLAGMLIYKQGIIWQGGPADIMLRRLVVPDGFDPTVDNPFAYENMDCDEWLYTDGSNPNYLKGLCLSPAINISGSTIVECTTGTGNEACAGDFPVADDGTIPDDLKEDQFPKVLEWRQCDGAAAIDGCENGVDTGGDLDDQSWENPYEVAKGHRGFLDGDYVMMMYAWSPNWQSNAVGNDHYNLYVRRSFDGGITWTTTPASWCDASGQCGAGLDALEFYYGETIGDFVPFVWTYQPGAFEQARNVSLLHGNKVTILDPRYSPTGGLKQYGTIRTDWLTANADLLPAIESDDALPYPDDIVRDKAKYMMIYETGDNTTVAEGEAVPLDLFYSRATVYGDFYEWYDYVNDPLDGDPVDGDLPISVEVEPRWPWLENATDDLSGEASVVLNPGGTFSYQVWNQWREELLPDGHELVYDSDMIFRRLLYLPDEVALTTDLPAMASILYVSTTQADYEDPDIILVGTGRDLDKMGNLDPDGDGIDNVRWWSDIEGHECSERTWQFPPKGLIPGWHEFSFAVQDNEGHWSQPKTVRILIAEEFHFSYLPLITR